MTAGPQLVEGHLRIHEDRPGGVVGVGPMALSIPSRADGMTQWFKRDWDARFERVRREDTLSYKRCYGGNLSFPRQTFVDAGGWRATARQRGGDVELGRRLQQRGLQVVMASDAWTTQHFPHRFEDIARNHERSGRGAVAICERHPEILGMELGNYHDASGRSLLLREFLLLLRPSARILATADPIIRRLPAADVVYETITSYFRWRGAREALGSDDRWRAVRRGTVILDYAGSPIPATHRAWLCLARRRVTTLDRYVADRRAHRLPAARTVVLTPTTLPDGVGFSTAMGINGLATPLDGLRRTPMTEKISLPRFIKALRTGEV